MSTSYLSLPKREQTEFLAEQVAILTLQGVGVNAQVRHIAKEYDPEITRSRVISLKRHPKYHEIIQKDAAAQISSGTIEARLGCIELIPDCIQALKKQIRRGNTKAIEITIKTAVGDASDDNSANTQAIQVVVASDGQVASLKQLSSDTPSKQ